VLLRRQGTRAGIGENSTRSLELLAAPAKEFRPMPESGWSQVPPIRVVKGRRGNSYRLKSAGFLKRANLRPPVNCCIQDIGSP